jgi:hypothetical protein
MRSTMVFERVARRVVSLPIEYRPRISYAARRERLLEHLA